MRARSTLTLVAVFLVGGVAATMLATPAMARESHVSSPHLSKTADASTASEGDRFRGYESHDVWGHWGTYYGPMVSVPRFELGRGWAGSVVGTLSGVLRIKLSIRMDSADYIAALGRIPNKWLGQVVSFRSPVKVDEPRRWW